MASETITTATENPPRRVEARRVGAAGLAWKDPGAVELTSEHRGKTLRLVARRPIRKGEVLLAVPVEDPDAFRTATDVLVRHCYRSHAATLAFLRVKAYGQAAAPHYLVCVDRELAQGEPFSLRDVRGDGTAYTWEAVQRELEAEAEAEAGSTPAEGCAEAKTEAEAETETEATERARCRCRCDVCSTLELHGPFRSPYLAVLARLGADSCAVQRQQAAAELEKQQTTGLLRAEDGCTPITAAQERLRQATRIETCLSDVLQQAVRDWNSGKKTSSDGSGRGGGAGTVLHPTIRCVLRGGLGPVHLLAGRASSDLQQAVGLRGEGKKGEGGGGEEGCAVVDLSMLVHPDQYGVPMAQALLPFTDAFVETGRERQHSARILAATTAAKLEARFCVARQAREEELGRQANLAPQQLHAPLGEGAVLQPMEQHTQWVLPQSSPTVRSRHLTLLDELAERLYAWAMQLQQELSRSAAASAKKKHQRVGTLHTVVLSLPTDTALQLVHAAASRPMGTTKLWTLWSGPCALRRDRPADCVRCLGPKPLFLRLLMHAAAPAHAALQVVEVMPSPAPTPQEQPEKGGGGAGESTQTDPLPPRVLFGIGCRGPLAVPHGDWLQCVKQTMAALNLEDRTRQALVVWASKGTARLFEYDRWPQALLTPFYEDRWSTAQAQTELKRACGARPAVPGGAQAKRKGKEKETTL